MKHIDLENLWPEIHFANHVRPKRGEDWGWRTLPDTELILVLNGTFVFTLPDEPTLEINPGQILLIYPDEPHHLRHAEGSAELSCIHCSLSTDSSDPAVLQQLNPRPERIIGLRPEDPLRACFLRCAETFAKHSAHRNSILDSSLREIWLRLGEHWKHPSDPPYLNERMQQMLDYLMNHLTEPVGRADLAREFNLTPEHINYLFKKELGISPGDYINRERIRRAFFLLQEKEIGVKETAFAVGFADPFHFSKTFKRLYGLPPGRVRRFMRAAQ